MKRGQAAMEFLMTYGWAILVVLVVIGALAYFGFLNPSVLVQERCTLAMPFQCEDYKVTATSVLVDVYNGLGEDITVTAIAVSGDAIGACSTIGLTTPIPNGDSASVTASDAVGGTCDAVSTGKDKNKYNVKITYRKGAAGQSHSITGEILAGVEV